MNGTTPAGNWTGLFRPGERVRLRFINGAANTFYDVRIPGLKLMVVQADGQDVEPVTVDEFRFGPGETYDVLVTPKDDAYTVFAQSMDRTGYARGTLAVRAGSERERARAGHPATAEHGRHDGCDGRHGWNGWHGPRSDARDEGHGPRPCPAWAT